MPTQTRKSATAAKSTASRAPSASATASAKPPKVTKGKPAPKSHKADVTRTPATAPRVDIKRDTPAAASKQSQLLSLLRSTSGATMDRMIEVTGWQAHSIRGCISAVFRKRMGLTVDHISLGTERVYRIAA